MADAPQRLIIGISGASGVIYGIRMLELLRDTPVETHLVISTSEEIKVAYATGWKASDVKALAVVVYPAADIGTPFSLAHF